MRTAMITSLLLLSLALCAVGCGQKAAHQPARPAARRPSIPLPEWAPKNPSPEFLRAWKALKPAPLEQLRAYAHGDKAGEAQMMKSLCFWPATYEFFGTLSDEQIGKFRAEKELRIRPRDLTERQRAALEAWFAAFREAEKGGDPETSDYQIMLYKMGAKEDLSNVRVGFVANGGHAVHIAFWITVPGGKEEGPICTWFAEL